MFVQIRHRRIEQRRIVAEEAKCRVARGAEQSAHCAGIVVVINSQIFRLP